MKANMNAPTPRSRGHDRETRKAKQCRNDAACGEGCAHAAWSPSPTREHGEWVLTSIRRWQQKKMKLLVDCKGLDREVAALNEQINAMTQMRDSLTHKRETLQSQAERMQYIKIDPESDKYGRLSCLKLCSELPSRLPPELKDMIYDLLIGKDEVEWVTDPHYEPPSEDLFEEMTRISSYFEPRLGKQAHHGCSRLPYGHWWHTEYVGDAFGKELAEHYYRTRLFKFPCGELGLLPRFLTTDVWGKGVTPGDHVQRLLLKIDKSSMEDADSKQSLAQRIEQVQLVGNKKAEILFEIECPEILRTDFGFLVNVLDLIAPVIYRLRDAGYSLLKFTYHRNWSAQYDITGLFDVSAEEWQDRMENKWKKGLRENERDGGEEYQ